MLTKHFLKILLIFIGMIVLGLIGVFGVSNLDFVDSDTQVAK
ncbi:MAG: hypothetical protein Q7K54_01605 [Candidatus Parcubacteria bacterium]|nr:hypothetical protein [Candidatus Parcubacteria bacterium]